MPSKALAALAGDLRDRMGRAGRQRVEELGRRSSYTYQLEALRAHLRDGTSLPVQVEGSTTSLAQIRALPLGPGEPLIDPHGGAADSAAAVT